MERDCGDSDFTDWERYLSESGPRAQRRGYWPPGVGVPEEDGLKLALGVLEETGDWK